MDRKALCFGLLAGALSVKLLELLGRKGKTMVSQARRVRVMGLEMGGTSCRVSIGIKTYNKTGELESIEIIRFK